MTELTKDYVYLCQTVAINSPQNGQVVDKFVV